MWAAAKLSQADFDDQITRLDGVDTTIRRGAVCICLDVGSRQPDPHCALCDGWGHYYPPARQLTVKVVWQRHAAEAEFARAGILTPAQIQVTWPSTIPLGFGDIFVHPFFESVETALLLQRGLVDPRGNSLERTRFAMVTSVEEVRSGATTYAEGVDWELGDDGRTIVWLTEGPTSKYSVRYRYRAQYILNSDQQRERHDDGALPWVATVTRIDSLTNQPDAAGGG